MDPSIVEEIGQGHLLDATRAGDEFQGGEALEKALLLQLQAMNQEYPGGLRRYVENARKLLESSRIGANPFGDMYPKVPVGERLEVLTDAFEEREEIGMMEIGHTGFVLVAGGLGERLGYKGIKLELPMEILTGKCFLQYYCEHILALQARSRIAMNDENIVLPLAIMTSDDTHLATVELLHKFCNFGMEEGQITLLKQCKVPAIIDNRGRFEMNLQTGLVETKPHGHGDVHSLLHSSGVLRLWKEKLGIKWLVFFQDTNALVFRGIVAALGTSASCNFDVNSITVARRPGEAVGAICSLSSHDGARNLTINVEYNQLDPLLRKTISPDGDVADQDGFSPYPGNINVLIFKVESYLPVLEETGGSIPEFVNPKYSDNEKLVFSKSTRLESMMQDYPKLLEHKENVRIGFTQLQRFIVFSAAKNNIVEAKKKFLQTGFPESLSSTENDVYATNRMILSMAGVNVKTADIATVSYRGLPFSSGAKVLLMPSFGTTLKEIRNRFPLPEEGRLFFFVKVDNLSENFAVQISDRSSLVLDGDIVIERLQLDGALTVIAAPGAKIVIRKLAVKNTGPEFYEVDNEDEDKDSVIRGYKKKMDEALEIRQTEPGETVIER